MVLLSGSLSFELMSVLEDSVLPILWSNASVSVQGTACSLCCKVKLRIRGLINTYSLFFYHSSWIILQT